MNNTPQKIENIHAVLARYATLLCQEIEAVPASAQQTKVSLMASKLAQHLQTLVDKPFAPSGDWTQVPGGASNASPLYTMIVADAEHTIRDGASDLINGRADMVAGVIVSRIAHKFHLAPTKETEIPEAF